MGRFLLITLLAFFITDTVHAQHDYYQAEFAPPLNIDLILSGNFGEIRTDHFHSGIDIKTQGVAGKKVFAVEKGYISRIKIESAGYGKTLYLTHPNGFVSVYAHLDRFREDIEKYVESVQYEKTCFGLNLYPEPERFRIGKSEHIAWSGNSGYSFGPHLHFELRTAARQHPVNALLFNFDIRDDIPPQIHALYVYPGSPADQDRIPAKIRISGKDNKHFVVKSNPLKIHGKTGFGLHVYDRMNKSPNHCGVFSVAVFLDSMMVYQHIIDEFAFSETRYVNSLMDYREKQENGINVIKTFVEPGNHLRIYKKALNHGLIELHDDEEHELRFLVSDAHGNQSELECTIIRAQQPVIQDATAGKQTCRSKALPHLPYKMKHHGIEAGFPAGSFYKPVCLDYAKSEKPENAFSPLHHVHNANTPVHKHYRLSIRPDSLPAEFREKVCIARIDEDVNPEYAGGKWDHGMVTTETRELGSFYVTIDTVAPEINPMDYSGGDGFVRNGIIRFRIKDDFAGISSYDGYIDNRWVLFEYDFKNDLLIHALNPERTAIGQSHQLELYITDDKGNMSFHCTEFFW